MVEYTDLDALKEKAEITRPKSLGREIRSLISEASHDPERGMLGHKPLIKSIADFAKTRMAGMERSDVERILKGADRSFSKSKIDGRARAGYDLLKAAAYTLAVDNAKLNKEAENAPPPKARVTHVVLKSKAKGPSL